MKLKNVLLATKQTALEYYRQNYDTPGEILPKELLERKKKEHEEHYTSLNFIKLALETRGISYQVVYMPYGAYEEFKDRDLIISVGGDGTVLNAAHYILDDTPILTVKSEGDSVGALCKIHASDFDKVLQLILDDDFEVVPWTRVEGKFGHKFDIALNEITVGKRYFNGLANYELNFNGQIEEQKSSKILISTGAGSTGLYANVNSTNASFHPESIELRYTVSEASKSKGYKMLHGHIFEGETLELTSFMDFNGCISFDGDTNKRMYPFSIGQKLYVKISDKPLNVILPRLRQ